MSIIAPPTLHRAWYTSGITEFLQTDPNNIIGQLTRNSDFPVLLSTTAAWLSEITLLQSTLTDHTGTIYFEFNIPRMGRRIDVVLIIGPVIFAIEFKTGESTFERSGIDQVWDYALDLKNFHATSHDAAILPILIATGATTSPCVQLQADPDNVYRPVSIHPGQLRATIAHALADITGVNLDAAHWYQGSYRPTPTIIEAARALYAQHGVEAITRSEGSAKNLRVTSKRIEQLIDEARASNQKLICFVTGVPGAGKTLVGLNVATHKRDKNQPTHATFLSGNGPLVAVLSEALAEDEYQRQKLQPGTKPLKGRIRESVKAFVQNVHHFRDEALLDPAPPNDHVVIFDEAQRAWNLNQTRNFMQRKKNQPGFNMSEPEFLIHYMDRHPDWAVIVCLVGGGQEINTGEAGIDAWIDAVNKSFPHWKMYISSRLTDAEYSAGQALQQVRHHSNTTFDDNLHLSVSMRSFRAENVSAFVKALLDCDIEEARKHLRELNERYPIAITRDLDAAKHWIRARARGSERYGMVASSKAQRLKPHAIDVRVNTDPVHYFLKDRNDTRSSYYLEDAATEFQVQGLELDWTIVTWDGDLRYKGINASAEATRPASGDGWSYHDFRGDKWCNIHNEDNRRYTLNAYRVLLTRARQGMVIFVPPGDVEDPTRTPCHYNDTYAFLSRLGICDSITV